MPIYEYQCQKCNHIFEVFHRITEEVTPACPKCLGEAKKIISQSNFILRGSGFYVNDYPSESREKGKEAEKDAVKPAAESSKSESQTEKPKKNQ